MTDQDRARSLASRISEIIHNGPDDTATPGGGRPVRSALDRELHEIGHEIIQMGGLVEEAIRRTLVSLEGHDVEAASAVIADDHRINELQRSVSELVTVTIATQSPVARDLRLLLALDHVATELERMGDYAASVAKQSRKLAPFGPFAPTARLTAMLGLAAKLVHEVIPALVDVDADGARAIAALDDDLDAQYHALFAEVLDAMRADPANVDAGARVLFAAHYTERIGDRTTNIAEDIVFLANGEVEDLNR